MSEYIRQHETPATFRTDESWTILSPIEQSIKAKIEKVGTPLRDWDISINYGIKTGFNEAFIINKEKRTEILANCLDDDERKRTDEIIRPILRGRDIKRYKADFADLYLINTHNGTSSIPRIDVEKFPAIKAHLDSFGEKLRKRSDQGDTPYNLRSCAYMDDFSKQKIVWGEISDKTKFYYDEEKFFCEATTFIMTGNNLLYLAAFLNSELSEYSFSKIGTTTGVGTVRWKKFKIEQLNVPNKIPALKEQEIERLFKQICEAKNSGINSDLIEDELNNMIYDLIGISKIEIAEIRKILNS